MEEIICKNCGSINDYRFEFRSGHKCAWCNGCGKYIKNVAHSLPRFYFGKYKGLLISDAKDLHYLEWFLSEVKPKANIKQAIEDRIDELRKETANG